MGPPFLAGVLILLWGGGLVVMRASRQVDQLNIHMKSFNLDRLETCTLLNACLCLCHLSPDDLCSMTIHPSHQPEARRAFGVVGFLGLLLLMVLWAPFPRELQGLAHYLPLHMALETLAIVVGALIFAVGWHTPREASSLNAVLLACAFLGVAILDFSHTLSYPGMPDFVTSNSADKSIHFWLVARALAALALLGVALLPWSATSSRSQAYWLLGAVVGLILATHYLVLFHLEDLPGGFIPGQGLTPFKITAEYGLVAVYLLAAAFFWARLRRPLAFNASGLFAVATVMAMSEFYFSLYADLTDAYNLLGHLYKVIAYVVLYRALFVATVQAPYERLRASQGQLQATLEALPDLLFEMSEEGRYLEIRAGPDLALLLPRETLIGKTLDEVMPAAAARTCREALREAKTTGRARGQQIQLDMPDGPRWYELSVARKPMASGEAARYLVISHDITQRKQGEAVRLQFAQAVEQNPNPILITDPQARIQYVNAAFTRSCGYSPAEVLGKNPRLLQSGRTLPATYRDLWETLGRGQSWQGEFINRRKNGEEYLEHALIFPLRDSAGEVTKYLAHTEDITAKEAAAARIQHLSNYDQLTDLPNRALLEERFQYALGLARPKGKHLILIWLDLDNFKDINDAVGHAAGDLLLREVAHRLRMVVHDQDTLSRQSGDDFVILLYGADQTGGIRAVTALQEALAVPLHLAGQELVLTASMGLAVFPGDGDNLETLLRAAEAAMYHAKGRGRNGYHFYAAKLQERSARLLALGHALKLALGRGELRLVYQPQVALADGHLIGVEALLRWRHPQWGDVSPAEFVPIAESNGLIVRIGDWVIQTALAQINAWRADGLRVVKVAVNLSAVQFAQPDLPERVARMARDLGIDPSLLEMELTEAVAMKDPEVAAQTMEQLVGQGFSLSIDDFGTLYSSLSYLKRFAVYKLKIDQSFVRDLDHDLDDQAIVKAIIQMAHSLELLTLAEGVETEAQRAFLQAQGCDEAQGYYFSRPLEVDAFAAYLGLRNPAPEAPAPPG